MEKKAGLANLKLFYKREKETHPHYQGKATINGAEFYVSSWVKEGKTGKYLSLSFKPIQEQPVQGGKTSYGNKDFDDFLNNL